jgi:hypothetical protein
MATASIDFTQQQQQTAVYKDSPTQSELTSMTSIGAILKPLYDAEQTFAGRFTPQMAMQVIAFRDAYWTPKSHDTVSINGVDMTWNDFVEQVFGVTRSWLNRILKRYVTTETDSTTTEELDVEESNDEEEYNPLAEACDRIRELEAEVETLTEELEAAKETAQPTPTGQGERDEVINYFKRVTGGRALVLQHELEQVITALKLDDRIRIIVE